jgi:hypothetical protein
LTKSRKSCASTGAGRISVYFVVVVVVVVVVGKWEGKEDKEGV